MGSVGRGTLETNTACSKVLYALTSAFICPQIFLPHILNTKQHYVVPGSSWYEETTPMVIQKTRSPTWSATSWTREGKIHGYSWSTQRYGDEASLCTIGSSQLIRNRERRMLRVGTTSTRIFCTEWSINWYMGPTVSQLTWS